MCELFRGDASVLENASLLRLKELTLIEPCLQEAPFKELCGDIDGQCHSCIEHTDSISFELLDSTPISSLLLPTIPSHFHAFHESLGDIRGSHPTFDPYNACLEDMPKTIVWSPFFDYTFDFPMEFDESKRPATLFALSFLVFSYSHNFEMHAVIYDKLLRALTASELRT